jgi:hypothetical protein
MEEEDNVLSEHDWEGCDDTICNLFGSFMQHPEEKIVKYFESASVAVEVGSLSRPLHNEPNGKEEGLPLRVSPKRNEFSVDHHPSGNSKTAQELPPSKINCCDGDIIAKG